MIDASPVAASRASSAVTVPAWIPIVAVIAGGTAAHVLVHFLVHGVVNAHQAALAFFLVLNVLINFWEVGLLACADRIREEYEATRDSYRGREMQRINEVFLQPIPVAGLLSFSNWTGIWSSYALFDNGYADRRSFGWNIDVGNGFSTVLPSTLFALGMTFDLVSPVVLGIVGVALFWQMFYGTVLYFFQFFHNGRHVGHGAWNIALFVGGSNGLWFVLSPWGLWVSVELILTGSWQVLR